MTHSVPTRRSSDLQTKRFDHREAQEQTARDARFGIGIAERALEVAAEHVADADTGEARTHRREAGTDELGCFWIHDLSSLGLTSVRSEEHTSELQSLMRISYAVFCLKKKNLTLSIILC